MKIALTGANGYIGRRLIRAAQQDGHEILALSRQPITSPGVSWKKFDFDDIESFSLSNDIDAIFHLAAATKSPGIAKQKEITVAQRLLEITDEIGADFIFISSQTAHENAPTPYGRVKWAIERLTLEAGGWVIRPGQVYGGPELGLFREICGRVRESAVLPSFIPAPTIQPVHVDDLAKGLLAYKKQASSSVICIAAPDGVSFTHFLKSIARTRSRGAPWMLPFPSALIQILFRLSGEKIKYRLGLDRLHSLFSLPQMETAPDLERLSLHLRSINTGMSRSGRERRELLHEGRAFLAYILRKSPTDLLTRRYVRAIEKLRSGQPLNLPQYIISNPALISLIDNAAFINDAFRNELMWRLNAASVLAEACPQGSTRFLGENNSQSFILSGLRIFLALVVEAGRRLGQFFLRPFLSSIGRWGIFK